MKKGASHVDWAISMGLFLIFIILTLIFLKPGTEPIYKPDALLKITEEGLKENGSLSLDKSFLAIELKEGVNGGDYPIRLLKPTQHGLNLDWAANKENLGLINNSLGMLPSELLLYTPYDLTNEFCLTRDVCGEGPPDCCYYDDVLDIRTHLFEDQKNILWLVYSEEETYDIPSVKIDAASKTDPDCAFCGCFKDGTCLLCVNVEDVADFGIDYVNCTYEFGVIETQLGFSPAKLEELEELAGDLEGYKKLKDAWGIPEDKDFKITVEAK